MIMGLLIVSGSLMSCSFGIAPCPFQAMQAVNVISKAPVGNSNDISPACVATFGMCQSLANPSVAQATALALGVLTPMPCIPALAGSWVCKPTVLIKGSPALSSDAKAMCAYGGVISFINSTQVSVIIK